MQFNKGAQELQKPQISKFFMRPLPIYGPIYLKLISYVIKVAFIKIVPNFVGIIFRPRGTIL